MIQNSGVFAKKFLKQSETKHLYVYLGVMVSFKTSPKFRLAAPSATVLVLAWMVVTVSVTNANVVSTIDTIGPAISAICPLNRGMLISRGSFLPPILGIKKSFVPKHVIIRKPSPGANMAVFWPYLMSPVKLPKKLPSVLGYLCPPIFCNWKILGMFRIGEKQKPTPKAQPKGLDSRHSGGTYRFIPVAMVFMLTLAVAPTKALPRLLNVLMKCLLKDCAECKSWATNTRNLSGGIPVMLESTAPDTPAVNLIVSGEYRERSGMTGEGE